LRVVELTGASGDVILLHPWLFHAPAPNRPATPRMMVGHNVSTTRGVARHAPVKLP
jgi:ectoine hydroxylase-related dioxygenase (phytanoyl-CoA dioxygenase family)